MMNMAGAQPLARAPTSPTQKAPVPPAPRTLSPRMVDIGVQVAVVAALAGLWEFGARFGALNPFLLPPLSVVLGRIWEDLIAGTVLVDLGLTLYRALAGFAIGAVIGIPLGILMARSALVRWFFDPLVSIGFPMPKIAFLPIFILWFDIYDTSKIIMVAFSCFFPIVAATYAGCSSLDKWPIWSARSFGAKERDLLWEVYLPMAMPQIITGLQVALPVGMITTIVTEMLMGGRGVGGAMIMAGRFADSVGVFAGIVQIIILGFVVVKSLEIVRRRILVWHPESRR
ncbi:binding-protein-dependent transport systems inner membrane component [Ancylobacter novellus DSM 506]|uniref:Binding-protein-dependent transport systems inner membrane component n=2 Tax=Ancylobacter novellus TaxID=921 RepID=D7A146_ANCN5|nr:binding-protein-dependent transport systems inner membrane component [Ancylobacter novellus DSM 506]